MSDSRVPEVRDLGQVTFQIEGPLGIVTLNRPQVLNAQGYELLAQVDEAFDLAQADQAIRVVIVRGAGGVFSAGHDLSPGQQRGDDPLERYNEFKKYNLDLLLKWRDFPKPTIAMVDGYCIYAGWMLAAVMDLVFASDQAQFLGGFVVQLHPLGPGLPQGQGGLLREPLHDRRGVPGRWLRLPRLPRRRPRA